MVREEVKRFSFIIVGLLSISCGVRREVVVLDSARVVYRDRIVRDTVEIVIPREVERIVTFDTTSFLQNTYSESEAVVSGLKLTHTLKSFPKVIKVPVSVEVHDTTVVEKQGEVVEVERKFSAWEKFWMTMGKVFAGVIVAVLAFFGVKVVKKFL